MKYNEIKLENERSQHLTKRLNRLSSWKFFKVLYRESMGRIFGLNLLLLLALAPLFIIVVYYAGRVSLEQSSLPIFNTLGIGSGVWLGAVDHFNGISETLQNQRNLWCVVASLLAFLVFSGGFAVIRDSFWIGKIKVFKPFWDGIKSAWHYALASTALLALIVWGIAEFHVFMSAITFPWLAVILTVILSILASFPAMFLLMVCSVATTYKQSFKQTIKDAWLLLWMNVIPNLFHFVVMLLPLIIYFILPGLTSLVLVFIMMIGLFYVAFVWQTHMMRTFALFHPVKTKGTK